MFGSSIDVYVADLRSISAEEDLLSVAELGQALEIAFSPRLGEYVTARTWVRRRLSEYLGCGADEIRFGRGERLGVVSPNTDLTVDLSYTGSVGVLVVGFRRAVAASLDTLSGEEPIRSDIVTDLAAEELDRFDRAINRERTYRQLLARKHALLRATGISEPLAEVDTSGLSPVTRHGYQIHDLALGDDLVASVATAGETTLNLTIDDTVLAGGHRPVKERVDALVGLSA